MFKRLLILDGKRCSVVICELLFNRVDIFDFNTILTDIVPPPVDIKAVGDGIIIVMTAIACVAVLLCAILIVGL